MNGILMICLFSFNCNNTKDQAINNFTDNNQIICNKKECQGTYLGKEFINGSDIAHQFSNTMSAKVGDQLKELYKSGDYSKVDFRNIRMRTESMGSGNVTYSLSIPFIAVKKKM